LIPEPKYEFLAGLRDLRLLEGATLAINLLGLCDDLKISKLRETAVW
jgi:hypothetical protein